MVNPVGPLRLTPASTVDEYRRQESLARRTPTKAEPSPRVRSRTHDETPRLRLTEGELPTENVKPRQTAVVKPAVLQATDPRWVLAVRVGESLEGTLLPADKRERLTRMGRMLGLTAFDTSLIIAIVQDQARRGHDASRCAAAGASQLAMVTPVQPRRTLLGMGRPAVRRAIFMAMGLLTLQAWWLVWWLSSR